MAVAFQEGDAQAMEELWANNKRGLRWLADKLAASGLGDAEDLQQEGFFGLYRAAEKFELLQDDEPVKFMTYAWPWIRQAMYTSIRDSGKVVRVPAHLQEKIWKYKKAISDYEKSTGAPPSDAQLCAMLRVNIKTLRRIRETLKVSTPASLDTPIGQSEDELTLGQTLADDFDLEEDVAHRIDHEWLAAQLQEMLAKLSEEKQQALRARYWEERPLDDREHMKKAQALAEISSPYNKHVLRPYYDQYLGSLYRGGLKRFKETGQSVVEELALRHLSRADNEGKEQKTVSE